jgi:hypothetical protein
MRYTSLVLRSMSSSSGGSVAVPVYAVIWVSNLPNAERSLSWNSMNSKFFAPEEFKCCRCGRAECAPAEPSQRLVYMLDGAAYGEPIAVTSGLRCAG